jgi:uncharacterized protein (DUF1800 family)
MAAGSVASVGPTRLDDPPTSASGLTALREDRAAKPSPRQSRSAAIFKTQAAAQLANAVTTPAPFRERLVWFWTNHFAISRRQGACACVAAALVQEAFARTSPAGSATWSWQ